METMAAIIALVFILLGALHLYWVIGGTVGLNKVIPVLEGKSAIEPGKAVTLLVAFGLIAIAGISFSLGYVNLESYSYSNYLIYAGWFLTVVFLARAVGDFKLVGFFKKIKGSEFATYDTKYYSPFCLLVSMAFAVLSSSHT